MFNRVVWDGPPKEYNPGVLVCEVHSCNYELCDSIPVWKAFWIPYWMYLTEQPGLLSAAMNKICYHGC